MRYYTQYKCTFVHNVRINNVPKQCVRLLYTYNLNIEENEVGPDSRQVPAVDNLRTYKSVNGTTFYNYIVGQTYMFKSVLVPLELSDG